MYEMAKSKSGGFFRSFSLPSSRVKKGQRFERTIEERQEEDEPDEEEVHQVLRMIKTLAVNAKKDFKKKKIYRYYCEEMIDRWIPDLKRLLRIHSREERRHREEAEAQKENVRRETRREFKSFSKDYEQKRNRTDEVAALKNKLEDELVRQKKEHDDAMTTLKREHQKELDRLLAEKESLRTRLSQAAGDKLRENNPNFSDLSDPYRPTKLSEMFSELYDNQWTDAMEILEADRQEKRAVETLLNILMKCFELCKESSESQSSSLRDACGCNLKMDKVNDSAAAKKSKEMLKEMAPWTVNGSNRYHALWKKLEDRFGKDDVEKCKSYIQKCVQCCWFMCVQDPAMQLTVWTIGTKMDSYNMKSFTKNGQYVDFSVWPALYLHKDGPLLSKGIVQGTNQASV